MARQPIYDRRVNIVAYELLFREIGKNEADVKDGDAATSEILIDAFTQWDIREIVGNTRAFVNFTKSLISKPPPFDKNLLVIELLEDVPIDSEVVANLRHLSEQGYTIALDDFVHTQQANKILPFANIVKIDLLQLNDQELRQHVDLLKPYGVKLLAEKVETHEEFQTCVDLGFDYFQGYFLCRPEVISNKKIPASKLAVFDLVQKLQKSDVEVRELETVVCSDPVLSFKILKLVNAASYAKVAKIESIDRAINYLGLDTLRSLASLLALSTLSDKPNALKDQSCIRAKLCELIGAKISPLQASSYFSVGLLSTLDAFFDKPLAEVVQQLTLHEDIETAILCHEGNLGKVLEVVCQFQAAEFDKIDWQFLEQHRIDAAQLNQINKESIDWFAGIRANLG